MVNGSKVPTYTDFKKLSQDDKLDYIFLNMVSEGRIKRLEAIVIGLAAGLAGMGILSSGVIPGL